MTVVERLSEQPLEGSFPGSVTATSRASRLGSSHTEQSEQSLGHGRPWISPMSADIEKLVQVPLKISMRRLRGMSSMCE